MSLMSHYPNGFANGLTIRGLPVTMMHPGQVFWVSNATTLLPGQRGGSNSNDGSYDSPFSTIDYAIGKCTASRGDLIVVKPGHAETLSAVGALAADVAGVGIIGLGTGSLAPTLSITLATAGVINISVANTSWVNIRFVCNVADAEPISMGANADGTSFESCVFTDTSTVLNYLNFITVTSACDNISFKDCFFSGKSASNDSFILMSTVHDRFYMTNCQMQNDVAQTSVVGQVKTTGDVTNMWIKDCFFRSNIDGALHIDFDGTACSGAVSNCHFSSIDTAGAVALAVDASGAHVFDCLVSGEANLSGITVHGPYVDL
jgi:hypothetical protein